MPSSTKSAAPARPVSRGPTPAAVTTPASLSRAIGFAALVASASAAVVSYEPDPATAFEAAAEPIARPAASRDRRFWGREAFVPDWIRGDANDAVASAHFLENYWPELRSGRFEDANIAISHQPPEGVAVFAPAYWESISPDALPAGSRSFEEPYIVHAARGESEPMAIGVRSDGSARSVSIEAGDFTSANGTLGHQAITNRLMLPYPARSKPGRRPADIVEQAMVLLRPPDNEWRFPPATTMVYVVDFHVPAAQPPGDYTGTITVRVDGSAYREIDVSLTVLPFTLKTNGFHAGAYGTTYNIWAGGFTGYTEEMMDLDSRYGFNLAGGFFNKGNEIPFVRRDGGVVEIDEASPKFKKFNATMTRMRRFGLSDVAFWNWGATGNVKQFNRVLEKTGFPGIDTAAGKRGFAAMCAALKQAEMRHGWPEFVINPYDEALKDQKSTRDIIEAIPTVRRVSPQTRLYMTEWRPGYTRLYQSSGVTLSGKGRPRERELEALLARAEKPRLNFDVIGANTLSDTSARLQRRLGGEYWHYGGASLLNAQARLAYGFVPWIVRADAALIWANYKGDFHGKGWTLHHAMPLDPDGRRNKNTRGPVIPSARAVAVREGIDDRKYIETLRYYATEFRSEPDLRYLDSLSATARSLLLNPDRVGGIDNTEPHIPEGTRLTTLRAEIRKRILRLLSRHDAGGGSGRDPR